MAENNDAAGVAAAGGSEAGGERKEPRRGGGSGGGRRGEGRGGERGGDRGGKGRGRKDRGDRDSRERDNLSETLIDVYRCSATVKGGRRLSFGALVATGDGKGRVGIGYGKAKEVPSAIQKALKKGKRELVKFPLMDGDTIPHQITGRFGASSVILVPAKPGTGVIAGPAVKAILEAGGVKNVLTKSVGSTNTRNIVKATMDALIKMRSRKQVEELRGVSL